MYDGRRFYDLYKWRVKATRRGGGKLEWLISRYLKGGGMLLTAAEGFGIIQHHPPTNLTNVIENPTIMVGE